jgi:methyl-accepting chemotaxis protein
MKFARSISSLKSMSIAMRLTAGFVSVLVLLAAVAATSALSMQIVTAQMQQIVDVNNHKTELANSMLNSINQLGIHSRTVALLYDVKLIQAEAKAVTEAEAEYLKKEAALKTAMEATSASEQERKLFAAIEESGGKTLPALKTAVKQGVASDNVAAVATLTDNVRPNEMAWRGRVGEFITLQGQLVAEATSKAAAIKRNALAAELTLFVFALVLGSLIAWRITLGVTRPVGRAVVVAERIAEGDLTTAVDVGRSDETGRLLQAVASMQDRLRTLVGDIRHAAESIHVASGEVATGNLDLSVRTEQTAANLQRAAASMDSLTEAVKQSADSAHMANKLASTAAEVAARGGAVVSRVVSTMDEINDSSKQIAEIISVIDGIAFQTNILALNAGVEAARAGEQGRGFAVVAGEVRNLASRSADAAKQIKALIDASVQRVEAGSRLVADAGKTMKEIVESVQRVSNIIGEITSASSEQSDGIRQLNDSVVHLDQMTQQNAALVEQGAAAAESLKEQAGRLTGMVGTFHL